MAQHASTMEPDYNPAFTNGPTRRETASSVGSDQYTPLPAGHYLMEFHGSCPRCFHQHNAVRIKINVSRDPSKVSRVACENCHQSWVAFGGRNTTRISLLAARTIEPDPVEKEVRRTLINMVKSVTAIASPILAEVPEATALDLQRERADTSTNRSGDHAVESTPAPRGRVSFNIPLTRIQGQTRPIHSRSIATRSALGSGSMSLLKRSPSTIRRRIAARVAIWRKATPKSGKDNPTMVNGHSQSIRELDTEHLTTTGPRPSTTTSPDHYIATREETSETVSAAQAENLDRDAPTLSPHATEYIAGLRNEPVELMDKQERILWMRDTLSDYNRRRAEFAPVAESVAASQDVPPDPVEMARVSSIRPFYRRSIELMGLGSHLGHFDGLWANELTHRRQPSSESGQTSDSTTIVEGSTVGSDRRYSWQGLLHGERRGSGSPRPPSIQSGWRSRQTTRTGRVEARYSLDSTAAAATARAASTNRAQTLNRRSRGSMARSSTMAMNELSMSQTSLPRVVSEAESDSDNNRQSPSPPSLPSPARDEQPL